MNRLSCDKNCIYCLRISVEDDSRIYGVMLHDTYPEPHIVSPSFIVRHLPKSYALTLKARHIGKRAHCHVASDEKACIVCTHVAFNSTISVCLARNSRYYSFRLASRKNNCKELER